MPTYEYLCSACTHQWEEIQKISEPAVEVCPKCADKTAKRQISGGSFILKGGGWYADLYSSTPKKDGDSKSAGGATKTDAASPAPAAKAETSSTPASTTTSSGGGSGGGASTPSSSNTK